MDNVRLPRYTIAEEARFTTTCTVPRLDDETCPLARAKETRARRLFDSSLQDLCLQTIAHNEAIYTTKQGKAAVQQLLSPRARTRLLTELARPVFDRLRYHAGKHRVNMVCTLIHGGLEDFDFQVLGNKLSRADNIKVWKCLADVAGQSLRTVHDVRVTKNALETRTLDWCLPHVARMPNLQRLQLTTLCCTCRDELVELAWVAPQLKQLKLHLLERCTRDYSSALHPLTNLEELEFHCPRQKDDVRFCNLDEEVATELLSVMPQLKVNCFRVDHLDAYQTYLWYDASDSTWKGRFGLEHLLLSVHESLNSRNCKQFKNVKHVLVVDSYYECDVSELLDCTRVFRQLTTISVKFLNFNRTALPLLEVNGSAITTLILDQDKDPANVNHRMSLQSVLLQCPNVTSLTVRGAKLDRTRPYRPEDLGHLQLRQISLINLIAMEGDQYALHFALSAPQLEEVHLQDFGNWYKSFHVAKWDVRDGDILQNLKSFKMSLSNNKKYSQLGGNREMHLDSFSFAQAVLCCCPKLQAAKVDLKLPRPQAVHIKQLEYIVNE